MRGVSSENYIDKRIAPANFFGYPLLLHHTAAEDYFEVGILLFYFLECADVSEEPVLGVLAHGAGVKKRYIRAFRLVRKAEAHFFEQTLESLAVGYIALAAECMNVGERFAPAEPCFKHCMHKSAELHLSVKLLLRNDNISSVF